MVDNVIPINPSKAGSFSRHSEPDEIAATVKQHNTEHVTVQMQAVENGDVRSLISIALNHDGSVNWMISGQCSSFEIIAALERTKIDFMDTE